jgi:hypothetical protein
MADEHADLADGVEHLQTAAKEVIRAGRSLLDAIEGLVDDPAALQGAVRTLGALAQGAIRQLGLDGQAEGAAPDEDDGKVERIRLS